MDVDWGKRKGLFYDANSLCIQFSEAGGVRGFVTGGVLFVHNSVNGCDFVPEWTRQYVREGDDQVHDFLKLDLNSYVVCGEYTLEGSGRSGFVSHLDNDSILWTILLRDSGVTEVFALDQLDANTIVFAGSGYRQEFGLKSVVGASSLDGQLLWLRFYNELNAWFAFDLRVTPDSTIAVAGGTPYAFSQQDAVVFKVDTAGTLLWSRAFGGVSSEHFEALEVLSTGEIVATGTGVDPTDFVQRLLVAKVTESGDSAWTRYVGSEPNVTGRSVTVVGDTLIAVAATYFRPDVRGQIQIVALDTNGFETWLEEFGTEYEDKVNDIEFDQYNSYLVFCGGKQTRFEATLNTAIGILDLNGNTVDSIVVEDSLRTYGLALSIDDSCVLYVGGHGWHSSLDRDREVFINRLFSDDMSGSASVPPVNEATLQASIFPNPFNSTIRISLETPLHSDVSVTLYDLLGREVDVIYRGRLSSSMISYVAPAGMASGVYFLRAAVGERAVVRKVVLLK